MENKDIKAKDKKANYVVGQRRNHKSLRKPELVILPSAFDTRLYSADGLRVESRLSFTV
jgi:hypothetical protein